jgi:hypothetical protein
MMRLPIMKRLTVALALCLAASGCGGAPKAEPAAAMQAEIAKVASRGPGAADDEAESTETPQIEAPADELFVIRIANPKTTLSNVQRLLSGRLSAISPEILLVSIVGPAQADIVDTAGPMDAISLDERWSRVAVSLGVDQRFSGRLDEVFELRERKGVRVVKGVRVAVDDDVHAMLPSCGFVTDAASRTRLLCATSDELLDEVSPYLARGLALQPIGADARVDMSVPRLLALMPADKQEEEDGPGERMGRELGKQFLADIERFAVGATWRSAALDVDLDLVTPSRRSVLTRVLTTSSGAGAAPPPSFFRLPLDASMAFYTQGATSLDLAPLRDQLFNAVRQDMMEEGYDTDLLDQISRKTGELIFTGGPFVIGAGMNRAAAEKALVALHDGKRTPQAVEEARRALASWAVIGLDEPPERWIAGVREFLRLDQALSRKRSQSRGSATTSGQPGAAVGKPKKKDRKEHSNLVEVAAPASLPKGTLHLEDRSTPTAKDGPLPHTEHIYIVADGSRTWIGYGGRDADVVDKLRIVLHGPAENTLARAAGIEPIQVAGAFAAGFFTLAGGATMFTLQNQKESDLEGSRRDLEKLGALPARGDTPIPWLIVSEPGSAGVVRTRMQMRLPLDALTDFVQLAR